VCVVTDWPRSILFRFHSMIVSEQLYTSCNMLNRWMLILHALALPVRSFVRFSSNHFWYLFYELLFTYCSSVVVGWSSGQLPPPLILVYRKIFFHRYKISGWKPPLLGEFTGRIDILNIHIFSVGNLQVSVRQLQIIATNLFITHSDCKC